MDGRYDGRVVRAILSARTHRRAVEAALPDQKIVLLVDLVGESDECDLVDGTYLRSFMLNPSLLPRNLPGRAFRPRVMTACAIAAHEADFSDAVVSVTPPGAPAALGLPLAGWHPVPIEAGMPEQWRDQWTVAIDQPDLERAARLYLLIEFDEIGGGT